MIHIFWKSIIVFCLGFFVVQAQKKAFTHPEFDSLQHDHQTLAIVPIPTQWNSTERPDSLPDASFLTAQAYKTQEILIDYFEKSRKGKNLSIDILPLDITRDRLVAEGIDLNALVLTSPKKLCAVLNVDAVVLGNLRLEALQFPRLSQESSLWDELTGKDFVGTLALKISDRTSGRLLWKYTQILAKNNGRTLEQILVDVSKKMGRKFPYLKTPTN